MGIIYGTTIGFFKGDTRSVDYSSHEGLPKPQNPTILGICSRTRRSQLRVLSGVVCRVGVTETHMS